MRKARSVAVGTLAFVLLLAASTRLTASEPASRFTQPGAAPAVTLRAASGATIRFMTHNGETVDGVPPQAQDLPHLVLYRNGALTAPRERTLIIEVTGLEAPPGGVMVTLEVTTQHIDPDATSSHGEPILVWRESRRITNGRPTTMTVAGLTFTHTFSEKATVDTRETPTPTDYFGYTITIASGQGSGATPLRALEGDYTFLMENQVVAPLPEVREESEGAAPDKLVVYYCDMFPFQRSKRDNSTRLIRSDVPHFVHSELVPLMVGAFRIQTDDWGFSWHQEWTSFPAGEDAERLSVALTDGQTWYHGRAPSGGYAGISLNTNADDDRAPYDTLSDDLLSTFHHELFHNLQRSINQHGGGDGRVGGADDAWVFFSEGTAFLASSVGLPGAHFGPTSSRGHPLSKADAQLASDSWGYGRMVTTLPVMYWRFLYEQCGGMSGGAEDPAAGMRIIRSALTTLYGGEIVDITSSSDLTANLPRVMDRALGDTTTCPFRTYEQSLVHLARALYGLHLDGGRCTEPGTPAGCGFYDPHNQYRAPAVTELVFGGGHEAYRAHNWTSLDVDLYEVILQPRTDGQSLELLLEPDAHGDAGFIMQVWKLSDAGLDTRPRPIPEQPGGPEVVGAAGPGERITYVIPAIDVTAHNRLAILITRVDVNDRWDPMGEYTIRLGPRSGTSGR